MKSQFNYGLIKATRYLPMSRVCFWCYCSYFKSWLKASYNMCHIVYNYNHSPQVHHL